MYIYEFPSWAIRVPSCLSIHITWDVNLPPGLRLPLQAEMHFVKRFQTLAIDLDSHGQTDREVGG